jgi:DivIVA domain-containing protein
MIDLTPLDVRNKRGDFKKLMRGYDPHEVDIFLELTAERLEMLVRENLQLRERTQTLQSQVDAQTGREQAVQDALVTAQELRADIQAQSQREADHALREAEAESRRLVAEAEVEARRLVAEAEAEVRSRLRGIGRQLDQAQDSMADLERRRARFLKEFRGLLQRELDVVDVEQGRASDEERAVELELGPRGGRVPEEPEGEALVVPVVVTAAAQAPAPGLSAPEDVHAGATESEPLSTDLEGGGPTENRAQDEAIPVAALDLSELRPDDKEVGIDEPMDVASLQSVAEGSSAESSEPAAARPSAPPADVSDEPSTLELELMAGASSAAEKSSSSDRYRDVPDLETLLAEAGAAESRPTEAEDIAPPPPPGIERDNVILFDPNDPDRLR